MDNETKFAFVTLGTAAGIVAVLALAIYLATSGPGTYGLMGN